MCKPLDSELLYGKKIEFRFLSQTRKLFVIVQGSGKVFFSKKTLFLLLHILPSSRVPILDMET